MTEKISFSEAVQAARDALYDHIMTFEDELRYTTNPEKIAALEEDIAYFKECEEVLNERIYSGSIS